MRVPPPWIAYMLLATAGVAGAELRFETTRIELSPKPDQETIDAVFEFENRGKSPVKILSVMSGCQCLEAKGPEGEVAPGAREKITGVFKAAAFPGTSEKTIQVRLSEGGKVSVQALTVAVKTQELIRIEPRTVTWTAGGKPEERIFQVTMSGDDPIRLLEVTPSRPGFQVRVETVKEGASYRVHVTPESSEIPALGVFRFKTDCKYPKLASPMAFGHVRK